MFVGTDASTSTSPLGFSLTDFNFITKEKGSCSIRKILKFGIGCATGVDTSPNVLTTDGQNT